MGMRKENVQDIFTLDSAQNAQLLHALSPDQDDPGLIQVRFRIEGPVDDSIMQLAWNDVIDRHDALRLTVQMPAGKKPMLVLGKNASVDVAEHDLSALTGMAQAEALSKLLATDRGKKLKLSDCPAMRLHCIKLAADTRQYLWTCHHIFLDGWSASIVLRDVLALYEARMGGTTAGLPKPPRLRSYLGCLNAANTDDAREFWHGYLGTGPAQPATEALQHSTGNARGKPALTRGDVEIPDGLAAALSQTASMFKSTPAALITLGWGLLLAACSKRTDVMFCKTVSGRNVHLEGIENMAGSLTRAVPVRCSFLPRDTVADVVQNLHKQGFAMQPHEHLPLDVILDAPGHPISLGTLDTLLVIQNHPWQDRLTSDDQAVTVSGFASDITSAFPLTLVVNPGEGLSLHYIAHDTLDAGLVATLMDHFPELLMKICADPVHTLACDVIASVQFSGVQQPGVAEKRAELFDDMLTGRTKKPGTRTELEIARIWQNVLGLTDIDIEKDFVSLGGRSFAAMRILTGIEQQFGKRIPLVDFVKSPTIPALAQMLDEDGDNGQQRWRTLVPIQPNGSKPPLVFLHVAGSHVIFLQPLAQRLGADQPIYAFQPVGLEGEAPPLKSFAELAAAYVDELVQVQPEGPYFIVGHCAGGRLALEVAYLLQRQGHEIGALVVIDTRAPKLLPQAAQVNFRRWLKRGRFDLIASRGFRKFVGRPLTKMWNRKLGSMDARKRSDIDTVERACIAADKRYKGRRHTGPILLLRSEERTWKPFHWEEFTEDLETVCLPIRHEEMFFEPDVKILADALARHLDALEPVTLKQVGMPATGLSAKA